MTESTNPIFSRIDREISENPVVLYMKGTKNAPMCGFSGYVTKVLQRLGVEFLDVNILEDQELRQGIKDFSNWPTIPQLYIKGEFIGGADIVRDMMESGELISALRNHGIDVQEHSVS